MKVLSRSLLVSVFSKHKNISKYLIRKLSSAKRHSISSMHKIVALTSYAKHWNYESVCFPQLDYSLLESTLFKSQYWKKKVVLYLKRRK